MINSGAGIRAMKRGLLAVFLVFAISSASLAGPLGVDIEPFPVIAVGGINISYNVLTGAFAANGFAQTLDVGTGTTVINAPFRILATIDSSGNATNANLTVGSVTTPLLSGIMSTGGFGYQAGTLEFLFGSLGGSYVPGIYSATKPLDVMLTVSAFTGSFATSWSSSFNTAQIKEDPPPAPNPEPSVLLLMLTAGGGLYARFLKRNS